MKLYHLDLYPFYGIGTILILGDIIDYKRIGSKDEITSSIELSKIEPNNDAILIQLGKFLSIKTHSFH